MSFRVTAKPRALRWALGIASLCGVAVVASCGRTSSGTFDRDRLESVEDLSESLANDLLAFSVAVRDRDRTSVERYLAEQVEAAPLPGEPPALKPLARWIDHGTWSLTPSTEPLGRQRFLAELEKLAWRFAELDDVRFKVKSAEFSGGPGGPGDAHLKFFVVGRNAAGSREWLKGTAHIVAERDPQGPWRIRRFQLESLESKVSREDLFSEVAVPAGVSAVFPAFGVGRNQGFVSHGAAAADVNGDGLLDLTATGVDQNYLYLNEGTGRFRDASAESLVKFAPPGSGALFLDFDNDGDPDLFLAAVGKQVLLENRWVPERRLEFWDISERAGVDRPAVGFSAVSADVNLDGRPDVYVCSYNHYGTVMPNSWVRATNGTANLLFVNRGDGTFQEAGGEWGVDDGRWSYAAGFIDIDADGDQDLYVANDFGENAMYRNDGGRFTDVAAAMGIVDPGFGMGVSWGDYDNDGDFDLHVTNMSSTAGNRILKLMYPEQHDTAKSLGKQAAGNSLYRNRGDGRFDDVTASLGGLVGGWAFGGGFVDFDNDGWQDLYTPNGFVSGKSMKDT
jgi:hypothetical protein